MPGYPRRNDPNSRTDGGGRVATGGHNRGEGKYGQDVLGPAHETSVSTRPPKRPLPTELADSRQDIYSTGYPNSNSPSAHQPASAPSLSPVPRGYIHNEPSFQPSTRDTTGGRITRRKV